MATALEVDVYAPMESPPAGRLYVIYQGSARYKGLIRSNGYSWGELEVMLPKAPLAKRAVLAQVSQHVDRQRVIHS